MIEYKKIISSGDVLSPLEIIVTADLQGFYAGFGMRGAVGMVVRNYDRQAATVIARNEAIQDLHSGLLRSSQ